MYLKNSNDPVMNAECPPSNTQVDYIYNKKVLLRERKRHTVRRVASACSAVSRRGEGGYPHPVLTEGYPIQSRPDLDGGTLRVPLPVRKDGIPPIQKVWW